MMQKYAKSAEVLEHNSQDNGHKAPTTCSNRQKTSLSAKRHLCPSVVAQGLASLDYGFRMVSYFFLEVADMRAELLFHMVIHDLADESNVVALYKTQLSRNPRK